MSSKTLISRNIQKLFLHDKYWCILVHLHYNNPVMVAVAGPGLWRSRWIERPPPVTAGLGLCHAGLGMPGPWVVLHVSPSSALRSLCLSETKRELGFFHTESTRLFYLLGQKGSEYLNHWG